jgi:release factor glutamine methyltransferase
MSHQKISLTEAQKARLAQLIDARNGGQPISRMRGKREFWSGDFYLNSATLDPRPDSEVLVSSALAFARNKSHQTSAIKVLDLGCGSGCLLLSTLSELPDASGLGVDCAALAVAQSRANAASLGLAGRADFQIGYWAEGVKDRFDIILSNPPYICEGDASLSAEVRCYDPDLALFGGKDGLAAYRVLLPQFGSILAKAGQVFLEVGFGQSKAVAQIAEQAGLCLVDIAKDLSGVERCLVLAKK